MAQSLDARQLHKEVSKLAPIEGVSIGGSDPITWKVHFAVTATATQRAAVASMLSTWTPAEPSKAEQRSKAYHDQALRSFVTYGVLHQEALAEPDTTKKAKIESERDAALAECLGIVRKIRAEIPDL